MQPFLSQRRCQGFWKGRGRRQVSPSLAWIFAKGMEGNTNSLKAEGLQPLLKVAPSHTLPHILSAWKSHPGYTLLNPCQVSHPLAEDTLVPLKDRSAASPHPPLPPAVAAKQQDQVAAEAALCQAAPAAGGLGCPPQGHCRDKERISWSRTWSLQSDPMLPFRELCNTRGSGGSNQNKPIKPRQHSSTGTGLRTIS